MKFTTKEITVEIIEDISAHMVYKVKLNGEECILGYNTYRFLQGYAKEEIK
ncbi:hypothetical protein [Bacillus cereus]|uniref:hypothetical protein n=1 Tax=Bacillus cereus TaxID=1396 RepID=UPI0015D508F3|nr:hypothetical protein [Bacillus cereus]